MDIKDFTIFFSVLISLNILAYILNIGVSYFWDKAYNHQTILTKKEVLFSLLTLFLNILIAIPGYILWVKGIIVFSNMNIVLTFILLFLVMDFLMYALHWASHNIGFLKKIHLKHHEHTDRFNCVSLYYMSPWEAVFFGLLLTVVALLFSLNIYGFIAFLVFNWFYGVITHLNGHRQNAHFLIFTTNYFHKNHHQLFYKNYGFYTFLWDKLFKTEKKKG
ncbi:fatty acid hydroxylase [Cellulophaga algicola DSM 14237]|uniref:Fatty acid hydroxylase n=1 Tax=Cellulophaga algicola (strain DSM 14237 / IC166 / ACAM 630) TaxID=688270 RepID=E6X8G4_CELAD|nr:sterol desaturase family protein [Cellulophaga algicola]ADV50820.1 fatty acid hydroxylase [Cellulophaga algicola DSM 14237]